VTCYRSPITARRALTNQIKNEFVQFLYISLGSLSELETQVIIVNRLGYLILINPNDLLESIKVIRKLINGLICSLKREARRA
jgi:four helix bundle protein